MSENHQPAATSLPVSQRAPDTLPWWQGATIYQIYPRSFADSNDDGVGDLPGITARLDHVASLGVDAIWLSPFFTSPMRDFGYDVADYCDVDPIFGTLADFDALLARAHELGLRLIIDQVFAHTSDQHPWFQASRSDRQGDHAGWYVWADPKADGSPPSNWQSVFGGPAWTWDARRRQYYFHNFLREQPQLNGHHPQVQQALLDVSRFWLDRGVDGFRLDALNFLMHDPRLRPNPPHPNQAGQRTRPFDYQQRRYNQGHRHIPRFIERVRALMDSYDGRFTVAEIGGDEALREMKLYTSGENRLNTSYGFDFLYADALTPRVVADAIGQWPDRAGMGWPSWAFENHDAPRAVTRWLSDGAEPKTRARFAAMKMLLLTCLRGNIFLYQGEELGLTQVDVPFEYLQDPEAIANWPLTLSRDGARTPMPWKGDAPHAGFSSVKPWLPVGADHPALAVDKQEAEEGSLLHLTRALFAFRKGQPALRWGAIRFLQVDEQVLLFERRFGEQRRLCLFNLGAEPAPWPKRLGRAAPLMQVGGAGQGDLPGYSGCVLEP
ncbi:MULTISPECIES: alpha-amylase family glycosyl hydrolase [Sphingobium]|uniref:alpha-amylase family glycosyl hydrolase n=1 Tax=Sphingobium TaxID=165695 RepID=UPI0015EB577F|nr:MULTISPECIES: alpha-amylase family glycosyl hydrolase [Sphingobium]MCW2362260.1 alpha-glucosidase [Sphingobium sp. B10D3B]MCW2401061.1 alpha-glucosidase [Sphingobium sp. B10D7B]MCW2408040.1 alpha-glucosidase [Sphingobium xanthum]